MVQLCENCRVRATGRVALLVLSLLGVLVLAVGCAAPSNQGAAGSFDYNPTTGYPAVGVSRTW